MPLTAKQTTAPSAATNIHAALTRSMSEKTATIAQTTPNTFNHKGERTVVVTLRRKRICSRSAASPMAATTTMAVGLRNAILLV